MSASTQASAPLPPEIRQQLDAVQPDYFSFFGLPEHLAVEPSTLQQAFYLLSRKLHPDRFARASAQDRADSLRASSILNDAYRTLREPLARAEYVLGRYGFDIGDQRSNNVPPELLEEVFELNMALDELRGGDDDARPQLQEAHTRFLAMRDECDADTLRLFAVWDATRQRDTLAEIRAILNRRRYIQNLVRDVEAALSA